MNPTHNLHMIVHYVYLLQSKKDKSFYIGCTSDLKKRLLMHNQNESYHTAKHSPWRLIYFEGYISKEDAYSRERLLKLHAQGLRRLKERLYNVIEV